MYTCLPYNYDYHTMPEAFVPKRPVIAAYPRMPDAFGEAQAMSAYLKECGLDAPHGSLYDEDLRKRVKSHEFDLLIVAGGDIDPLGSCRVYVNESLPMKFSSGV